MSQREIVCASCGHPARIVHQDGERDVHAVLATFVEPLDPFPVRRNVPRLSAVRERDQWSTRREQRALSSRENLRLVGERQ